MDDTAAIQIKILQSIDSSLKLLVKRSAATQPKAVASDQSLDGKFGDPIVKFMPRFWAGDNFKGKHYSECPPELLDLVAESNDWAAGEAERKDEKTDAGKPVAQYRRWDAEKARGWAKRKRDGWVSPAQPLFEDTTAAAGWQTAPKSPLPPWAGPSF